MDPKYLLKELFRKVALMRKAQKAYYDYKADPKTDPIKKAYLQDAQRREQDVDRLMVKIPAAAPELATELLAAVEG